MASITAVAVVIAAAVASLPKHESPSNLDTNKSALGQEDNKTQMQNIIYNVKFECGTISGDEGPLRPGHYDTDVGILNKQDFEVKILWSATANDGRNTNSILKTLQPQGVTGLVCKDLRQVLANNQNFVEGFVIIDVAVEPGLLGSLSDGATVLGRSEDINILEVQAFYTANALDELPRAVLVDKITFVIRNDTTSGRIPLEMIGKTLDITLPSNMNEISDPETKVRNALAEKYALSDLETAGLEIEVHAVGIGVGTMIDDHAVSLSKILPQASG